MLLTICCNCVNCAIAVTGSLPFSLTSFCGRADNVRWKRSMCNFFSKLFRKRELSVSNDDLRPHSNIISESRMQHEVTSAQPPWRDEMTTKLRYWTIIRNAAVFDKSIIDGDLERCLMLCNAVDMFADNACRKARTGWRRPTIWLSNLGFKLFAITYADIPRADCPMRRLTVDADRSSRRINSLLVGEKPVAVIYAGNMSAIFGYNHWQYAAFKPGLVEAISRCVRQIPNNVGSSCLIPDLCSNFGFSLISWTHNRFTDVA